MVGYNQFRRYVHHDFFKFIKVGCLDMQAFDIALGIEDLCVGILHGRHSKGALHRILPCCKNLDETCHRFQSEDSLSLKRVWQNILRVTRKCLFPDPKRAEAVQGRGNFEGTRPGKIARMSLTLVMGIESIQTAVVKQLD